MDVRKGKQIDVGRRQPKTVTQTWRAVSTHPNYCHGDGSNNDRFSGGKLMSTEKYSMSMEIGASLMRFIKGGPTQEEIEEKTGVNIIFPSSREEESIIIKGKSTESVTKASEKIQSIIDKAVNGRDLDYSHFVSIPLANHPALVEKLVNFQNSILGVAAPGKRKNLGSNAKSPATETCSSKLIELGIARSIFINPKTFHLTVLMLKLWNKDRVKAAAEVLQSVSQKVKDALDDQPVFIRLKGLDCMRGSLSKALVLYAPVEVIGGEDRLLRACQVIIDAFVEAGLVIEKDLQQKLKLHATLMNARHRKRKKGTTKVDSFDARGIYDLYGSEKWGEYPLQEAHLSQRFMYDENGFYHCCTSIPFPDKRLDKHRSCSMNCLLKTWSCGI